MMNLKNLAVVLLISNPAFALIEPKIKVLSGKYAFEPGAEVSAALKKYDSTFKIWKDEDFSNEVKKFYKPSKNQMLAGVVADFNGDKIQDAVLMGRTSTHSVLLAALSQGKKYLVSEINKGELIDPKKQWVVGADGKRYGLETFLTHAKAGKIKSPYEEQSLDLKTDAFEEVFFEKAAVLYFFKNGKFEQYTTAD